MSSSARSVGEVVSWWQCSPLRPYRSFSMSSSTGEFSSSRSRRRWRPWPAVLFGIAPAFRASRVAPIDALNAHGRSAMSRSVAFSGERPDRGARWPVAGRRRGSGVVRRMDLRAAGARPPRHRARARGRRDGECSDRRGHRERARVLRAAFVRAVTAVPGVRRDRRVDEPTDRGRTARRSVVSAPGTLAHGQRGAHFRDEPDHVRMDGCVRHVRRACRLTSLINVMPRPPLA